jgi:hypothetical protein
MKKRMIPLVRSVGSAVKDDVSNPGKEKKAESAGSVKVDVIEAASAAKSIAEQSRQRDFTEANSQSRLI